MQPRPPAESDPTSTSWNNFHHLVLEIIAELSPCSEPKLFIVAATRGLERFGDGSLSDFSKLLSQCAQELQVRGLVEINGEQLVIAHAGCADENILDLTTEVVGCADENILDLTTEVVGCADENILDPTGCTERAPEPTREETIAAIRRLIGTNG